LKVFLILLLISSFLTGVGKKCTVFAADSQSNPSVSLNNSKSEESKPKANGILTESSMEKINGGEVTEGAPSGQRLLFDLTDCVRMALRNNAEIRGADYDIDNSKWKLKEAQPRGIPVVTYEYEAAPVPKNASDAIRSFFSGDITMLNRAKIGLGFPVSTFGKIQLAQSLAREGVDASYEKKNQKAGEVVLKIKQLYNGILLGRELRGMLLEASTRLDTEISKRETETQPTDPVDLARLKLTRFEVERRQGEVDKKLELALEGLRIQMGMVRSIPFEITDRHLTPVEFELKDLTYYLGEAKRYRPESRLLDIAMKAKEDEYRLEKRKLFPNLGVGAFFEVGRTIEPIINQGQVDDFNNPFNFTRAGFGLRMKGEFNWRESSARIRQKQAEYYKMSVTKDAAEEGLDLDLRDSYLSVKQSKVDLENSEKAYRLARQLVFLTKSNFDVGVGDKKDYGDSLQSYLLMKGRYFESVFNYNVAVATLISKVGYQYSP
jgi:outer membrane protein TolC